MLLKYFDRWGIVAEHDDASGALVLQVAPPQLPWELLSGCFTILSGVILALYRVRDDLWLRVGDRILRFEETPIHYERTLGVGNLVIGPVDGFSAHFSYPLSETGATMAEEDFTPFASEEDFDFGHYLVALIQDPDRRSRAWSSEG